MTSTITLYFCPSDRTFDVELSQQDDDVVSFRPVDSVSDDILHVLGGDVPSQSPTYSVINRPLGGNLPVDFKQKIWNGDFINLHMLLKDQEFEDPQNQRLSLELTQIGSQQASTMAKAGSSKPVSSYCQWVSAFSVNA